MSNVVERLPVDDIPPLVYEILHDLGTPQHLKGYHQLAYAIYIYSNNILARPPITKYLYPKVAEVFDTLPARVERDIRTCIDIIFTQSDYSKIYKYFGNSISKRKCKATNGQFISVIADVVHRRLLADQIH